MGHKFLQKRFAKRVYAKSREEANELGGIFTKQKYSLSVMVWVCMCKKGASYNFIEKGIKIDSILLQQYLTFAKREGDKIFFYHLNSKQYKKNLPLKAIICSVMKIGFSNKMVQRAILQTDLNRGVKKATTFFYKFKFFI